MSAPSIDAAQSMRFSPEELRELNARFDKMEAQEIVRWSADTFGVAGPGSGGLVMTSSFGADSMCTLHLATQVVPEIPVVFINTGYLFAETIQFMEAMRSRFRLNVREYHTHNDPIVWLTVNGESDARVRNNRDACCAANKNSVMDRAMKELAPAAWMRGVRGGQTEDRARTAILQWFPRYSAWAVSPILRWSSRDVFQYMKRNDLPHHPLWDSGYVSIGCNPASCTRPIAAGEDERAGRWSGSDTKECGINLDVGSNI